MSAFVYMLPMCRGSSTRSATGDDLTRRIAEHHQLLSRLYVRAAFR